MAVCAWERELEVVVNEGSMRSNLWAKTSRRKSGRKAHRCLESNLLLEGIARTTILMWECAWCVRGTPWGPQRQEWSEGKWLEMIQWNNCGDSRKVDHVQSYIYGGSFLAAMLQRDCRGIRGQKWRLGSSCKRRW